MEQWNERQQLLAAKLDEIRKRPGNLLTGCVSMHWNATEYVISIDNFTFLFFNVFMFISISII